MHEADEAIRSKSSSNKYNNVGTKVSVDGTWNKRRLTSHNGAVAAISIETGRVLDVEVLIVDIVKVA